ncbi:type VI secretion system tube protein TssD [Ulvibacter litoralis]|uniref:Uncharacterized protein n=1 Tax=Ulvibacter litoralis TaxID=227084 RepID=A0A1G7FQY9_9FLAO|nr:type VI secretion system tube protein TssD [Ulvibacter litoralis]GHC50178.1 hypothetical protein GCM10008083_12090 [Ulvibacter litoralis]SDE78095.1 hypothetical protein SAMN05421855_102703 [Ulvibacter litoralis]
MSFKATLFINNEERTILDAGVLFKYLSDNSGQVTSRLLAKPLSFTIESTRFDTFFYDQIISPTSLCEGEIIFYKRDGFSTLFKIEFANAHITHLSEHFTSEGIDPMKLNLEISWGIIRMKGLVYEQPWNPYNPFVAQVAPTELPKEEKKVTKYYITDVNGEELESYKIGEKIILNIETLNRVGDAMTISLEDKTHDFKYNGKVLANDTLSDYIIGSDLEKIELEVVPQEIQN